MSTKPIMLVTLTVRPEKEAEFSRFYHHEFFPQVADAVPEFTSIRRYEEISRSARVVPHADMPASLAIYEIVSEQVAQDAYLGFARPSLSRLVAQFQRWKEDDFSSFTRVLYKPVWSHLRVPHDGAFGSRPVYLNCIETKPEHDASFMDWYRNQYLKRLMADVPEWMGCRIYESIGTEPIRRMTFFEADCVLSLQRSLDAWHLPHRAHEQSAWKAWEERTLDYYCAAAYRQVFRLP